jgi:hypothetical protein
MALQKIQDTTYQQYISQLQRLNDGAKPYALSLIVLFALLYGVGMITNTVFAVPISLITTFHMFLYFRRAHYTSMDTKVNGNG